MSWRGSLFPICWSIVPYVIKQLFLSCMKEVLLERWKIRCAYVLHTKTSVLSSLLLKQKNHSNFVISFPNSHHSGSVTNWISLYWFFFSIMAKLEMVKVIILQIWYGTYFAIWTPSGNVYLNDKRCCKSNGITICTFVNGSFFPF